MTAREVIAAFSAEGARCRDGSVAARRIDRADRDVYNSVLALYGTAEYVPVTYPDGLDRPLLAAPPYDDIYIKYLRMEDAAAAPADPSYPDLMRAYYTRLAEYAAFVSRTRTAPKRELTV